MSRFTHDIELKRAELKKRLTKTQRLRLDVAIERQVTILADHFRRKKNGGWPLDYLAIESMILQDSFGPIEGYIFKSILNAGYELDITNGGTRAVIVKRKSTRKARK